MKVHRRPCSWILLCALMCPAGLGAQGVRGELSLNWGWLQLRPYAVDSVPASVVGGSGLQRQRDDGTTVTCIDGEFCRWYEVASESQDITPFSQDLRLAGWTGVQGLSFHGQLRTRFGSDDAWPRTEQEVDPVLDANQKRFNETPEFGKHLKGDMHHVASVPIQLLYNWSQEWGLNMYSKEFKIKMVQRLNDPDYKKLKVMNTRI